MVIFGGRSGSSPLSDTWEFDGVDADIDGLTDCGDPDCEGIGCGGGICAVSSMDQWNG